MGKENLISVIDMMKGLTDEEKNSLLNLNVEELERYYRLEFLEQNEYQIEKAY